MNINISFSGCTIMNKTLSIRPHIIVCDIYRKKLKEERKLFTLQYPLFNNHTEILKATTNPKNILSDLKIS